MFLIEAPVEGLYIVRFCERICERNIDPRRSPRGGTLSVYTKWNHHEPRRKCSKAVLRVPLLRRCTPPRGPEIWRNEAMDQHIVMFEFVRETSFFELFSVFELLCMAG